MGFVEFVFGLTFVSIIMGGLVKIADRDLGLRGKATAIELTAAQDRIRQLEAQVRDSHYQNEQLQTQLEWHTKLLETQDRFTKQLAAPSNHASAALGVARTA